MRLLLLMAAGGLLLFALGFAAAFYPVRLLLVRDNGKNFRAVLSYLWFHTVLQDTAHPVDPKKFTRRYTQKKRKKARKKAERQKQEKENRWKRWPFRAFPTISDFLFYLHISVAVLRVLGAERVRHLQIHLRHFSLSYGTGDPAETFILHGAVASAIYNCLSFLRHFARLTEEEDSVLLSPDFQEPHISCSFSVTLSIPLIYYFSVFHLSVPNEKSILVALTKRRKKLEKERAKQFRRGPVMRKAAY